MREPSLKSEGGRPSGKLRLTLLISFGGLLALMVIAGLDPSSRTPTAHAGGRELPTPCLR